jgi:beta-N-acetylhexosaminidase
VDVLLMPTDPRAARDGIVAAVRDGRLDRRRVRQAAARQIALLLHHRATAGKGRPPGASYALSQRLSATALTSVAGPCEGVVAPDRPIPLGDPLAVANFRVAAENAGLALGEVDYVKPPPPARPKPPRRQASKKAREDYRKTLRQHQRDLARWRRIDPRPVLRGTRLDLVGAGQATPPGSYVVAVDAPYVLGRTGAAVRIATYGDTIGAMTALVAFLQGKAPAPGRLPVPIRGVRSGC